jgi:choline dehydrogenase-like flavoprotein
MAESYDLIVVGTSFASSFFLHRYLARRGAGVRVLVLERGQPHDHKYHLAHREELVAKAQEQMVNETPQKPWVFQFSFGGGSNCWFGSTPRMTAEDFRLHSLHGQGRDWPLTYDELEPYYCDAEDLLGIAGPSDDPPQPRSRPFPLPAHRFSQVDARIKQACPDTFFAQPCARPSRATSRRPRCCASGVCHECPIDSKFTILNEMRGQFEDDQRVHVEFGADVTEIDVAGSVAKGVRYRQAGVNRAAAADLVALGANAIMNPFLLLRSGLDDGVVGRGLVEQVTVSLDVHLDGIDNFDGSTANCGIGYMRHDGVHRRDHAAALMMTYNFVSLRRERGRWRQRLVLDWTFEDLPQPQNRVTAPGGGDRPHVHFAGHSAYAERAIKTVVPQTEAILSMLPIEKVISEHQPNPTESHILCTTPMGNDPATSVVDASLLHHRVRNLAVLGSSTFATCAPANPTLTLSALSLRAADRVT